MTLRLSTLVGLVGLALVAGGVSCSSGDDDTAPAAKGGSSGSGKGGSSGSGGTDGLAGDDSGGTSSAVCPPPGAAGASELDGASGQTGTAGEAGDSSQAPPYTPPGDCTAGVAATPWLHTYGNEIMDVNGNAVILRGVAMIDLGSTEQLEGGVNAMIDRLTAEDDPQSHSPGWATRVVRLVVSPSEDVLEQLSPDPYVPDSDYYERLLRPAVDHAREKGLYAIIDWHYTDGTDAHTTSTDAFWAEMAPHFARDSNVIFELFNEPTDGGSWFTVKANMQLWYDTVRKHAPENLVLVGTANFDQLPADAAIDPVEGTNIAYVAH
ncbi:MAG TPA: cellulase family glycosylhydrolase, partial [Polyangiaceae bacterium]|nr:cellulase family glycosylhydrolase [Polyangiaceae bacterium]